MAFQLIAGKLDFASDLRLIQGNGLHVSGFSAILKGAEECFGMTDWGTPCVLLLFLHCISLSTSLCAARDQRLLLHVLQLEVGSFQTKVVQKPKKDGEGGCQLI